MFYIKQNYLTGKVADNLLKREEIMAAQCFLNPFILHRFDQWKKYKCAKWEGKNKNRSDTQMAPVSPQFLKQMFFRAGYSISLSPGTLKRKYKDPLGIMEIQHIYCAKYLAL